VTVDVPFVGVSLDGHGSRHREQAGDEMHGNHGTDGDSHAAETDTMLKVMAAIENDDMQLYHLIRLVGCHHAMTE
jgi:hypothetical protein